MLTAEPDIDAGVDLGLTHRCTLRRVVGNRPICQQPTAWAVRLGCCGHVKEVCDRHRDLPDSILPGVFRCTVCGTKTPPIVARWPV